MYNDMFTNNTQVFDSQTGQHVGALYGVLMNKIICGDSFFITMQVKSAEYYCS